MSLSSQRLAAVPCEESPAILHTALLKASDCLSAHWGDSAAAIARITRISAEALTVERVGVWLYHAQTAHLVEANTYVLSQRCHTSGRQLQTADYPEYFSQQATHPHCRVLESTTARTDPFIQRWLIPRDVGAFIAVPVYQRGQVAGWMWYEHTGSSRSWQSGEQTFAISMANLVTIVLQQQLQQQQRLVVQQQQHTILLGEILRTIGTVPSDVALLQQLAQQASDLYQAIGCEIWRYSPGAAGPLKVVVAHAATPVDPSDEATLILSSSPQTDMFLQQVLETPEGLMSIGSSPSKLPTCLGQNWIILPTLYGGSPNGMISLRFAEVDGIPDEQARLQLQDFAIHIGIVLAHAQLLEQEKNQQGTLSRQHKQLQREIIERQQAEQAWQESQRFIQSILDASTNILYVNNFDTGENFYVNRCLTSVLGYNADDLRTLGKHYLEQLSHPDDIPHMRSQRSKLAQLDDSEIVESEYRFRHQYGGWRWLLCRETVFQRDADGRPTQIFGTATDITQRKQAEVALHEVNQELQRLASIDGLTEVANRRCFDRHLSQAWENMRHSSAPLTLILCDIDYFKRYNDEYGHQSGDVCLKKVAQAITQAVKRTTDLVARYGGEEFAIVLPNTNLTGAQQVTADIQQAVGNLKIPHCRSLIGTCVTVSLGVACIADVSDSTPDGLIAAADRGLYRAKYEGRNRTCTEAFETL